jgi:hypothetical protein
MDEDPMYEYDWRAAETGLMGGIDSSVPHSARVQNYLLGGKDNYPVDQEMGETLREIFPGIDDIVLQSWYFLVRAIEYLAGEAGVRQFIDLGVGLPVMDSTHKVAQRVAPESRVVYVDNDPLVMSHAEALLTGEPPGATDHVCADVREVDDIVRTARRTLDFARPIALLLVGVLGHITDDDEAQRSVTRLLEAVPVGSFLVIADGAAITNPACPADAQARAYAEAVQGYNDSGADAYQLRSPERIARFFDGLELIEPGVVSCPRWRPDPNPLGVPPHVDAFCAVGRK